MILREYYTQKRQLIFDTINENIRFPRIAIGVGLFNDLLFRPGRANFPLVLFKYNKITWSTSSENEYKADVNFSVYIALSNTVRGDYLQAFDLSQKIDEVILLRPTTAELKKNKKELADGITQTQLIANSAFKISEGQYTVEGEYWDKNNFFIWEINYKTTLIESFYKKKYTMIANGAFVKKEIKRDSRREEVRLELLKLGYDLNDYYEKEYNGKKLLQYKDIQEKIELNENQLNL